MLFTLYNVAIMENNFPKIDLFPRITKVGNAIASIVRHLPHTGYPSERGAEAMLSRELDRERELTQQALTEQDRSNVAPWVYERLGD